MVAHDADGTGDADAEETRARNNVRRVLREQFTKTAPISVHTLPQPVVDIARSAPLLDTPEGTACRSPRGLVFQIEPERSGDQSVGPVLSAHTSVRCSSGVALPSS